MATPTGIPTLSPPATAGGGFSTGPGAAEQNVHGDDQHIAFNTTDNAPGLPRELILRSLQQCLL